MISATYSPNQNVRVEAVDPSMIDERTHAGKVGDPSSQAVVNQGIATKTLASA